MGGIDSIVPPPATDEQADEAGVAGDTVDRQRDRDLTLRGRGGVGGDVLRPDRAVEVGERRRDVLGLVGLEAGACSVRWMTDSIMPVAWPAWPSSTAKNAAPELTTEALAAALDALETSSAPSLTRTTLGWRVFLRANRVVASRMAS